MKEFSNKVVSLKETLTSHLSTLSSKFRSLSTPLKVAIPVILLLSTILITSIIEQQQEIRSRAKQCESQGQGIENNPNCTPTEEPTSAPQPTTEPTTEQPTSVPPTDVPPTTPISTSTPTPGGIGGTEPTSTPTPTTTPTATPTPTNTPTPTPTNTPTPTSVPIGGSTTNITYIIITSAPTGTGQSTTTTANQTTTTTRGQTNIIIQITQTPTPSPSQYISTGQNSQISPVYTVPFPGITDSSNLITFFLTWIQSLVAFFEGLTKLPGSSNL